MRDAFWQMRRFLTTSKGLTEDEAISLMSVAVDFGVTQVVEPNTQTEPIQHPQLALAL